MALKLLSVFRNHFYNPTCAGASSIQVLVVSRSFATKAKKKSKEETCPNQTCPHKKKRSIWNLFKKKKPLEKPPLETCKKYLAKKRWDPDPDLSQFGGTPYRTCGPAYIIQKDQIPPETVSEEPEDKILQKLEKHPDLKDVVDPMPPFESVEQRLLELSERKLHPLYKRYLTIPLRKYCLPSPPKFTYKSRSGPIAADDIPSHLRIDKTCLEQKNIFSEFKRVEPPRQLLAKMVEIKQNERPSMGGKKKEVNCPQHRPVKDVNVTKVMNVKK